MESTIENGDSLPYNDPDFNEIDSKSGSFDEYFKVSDTSITISRADQSIGLLKMKHQLHSIYLLGMVSCI